MKIKLPKKISHIKAKKFIEQIFKLKFKNYKSYINTLTKIDYQDLYNLFYVVTQNKRIKVIEFGSGISTFIFSEAIEINKKNFEKRLKFKKNLTLHLDKKKKFVI